MQLSFSDGNQGPRATLGAKSESEVANRLNHKVGNALNESRILILGAQVLLGFQFRSAFEPGFSELPRLSQGLTMGGLGLLLLALALLISPAAYHRIVERGEDSESLYCFSSAVMNWALLPFAFSLAIDFYVVTERLSGAVAGIIMGVAIGTLALFFWYALELREKNRRNPQGAVSRNMKVNSSFSARSRTRLSDKVDHVLTETRLVLPGAQALLGFQLAIMLMEGFTRLPVSSKYIHLVSLGSVALCTIFLIAPAAYHRIVEAGEDTELFHRFATRMVLAAMVALALGVSGDLYVVVRMVTNSVALSLFVGVMALCSFLGLWFGATLYIRQRRSKAGGREVAMSNATG